MNKPEVSYCINNDQAIFTFTDDSPFSEVGAEVVVSYNKIDDNTWEVPAIAIRIENTGLSIDYQVNLTEQMTMLVDAQRWLITNREFVAKTLKMMG